MDLLEFFPYEPRGGQESLLKFIQREVREGRHVCVHAPTGFGKTPVILAALLPFVEQGGAIVWAVRTGTETDRPIEELKTINERLGTQFVGLSYRGKRDMCSLARDMEFEDIGYDEVTFLCKSKVDEGECEYHSEFHSSFHTKDFLKPMLYSEILSECERRGICPYLAQREILPFSHVAAMSYNYILSEGMGWSIKPMLPFKRSFLVVDEAHNLQQACSSLNSMRITLGTIDRALKEIELFKGEMVMEIQDFILRLRSKLTKVLGELGGEAELYAERFLSDLARGEKIEALHEKFDSIEHYGTRVRQLKLRDRKRPSSSLHALGEFWLAVLKNLDIGGMVLIASDERGSPSLELWDMRASEVLREKWGEFRGCVFCSGTLEPIDAFADVIGLDGYRGKTSPPHYDPRKVKSLVLEGLTTKGEELSETMAERYVSAVEQLIKSLNSNIAIFCSSYRIQADLLRVGLKRVIERAGRRFYQEVRGMSGDEGRRALDEFKRCASSKSKGVLCASAGGRFAEGADFPGKELEAIFLVGIPFERMTVRTQLYLDYYEGLYGKQNGRYYAYIVPALKRASQALGRALRSSQDRAFLVCGDERYAEKRFFHLLPSYVRESCEVVGVEQLQSKAEAWLADTSAH